MLGKNNIDVKNVKRICWFGNLERIADERLTNQMCNAKSTERDQYLRTLIKLVTCCPNVKNIQNWRFCMKIVINVEDTW